MTNPRWEVVDSDTAQITESKFRAIYPATMRLPTETIERIMRGRTSNAILPEVARMVR